MKIKLTKVQIENIIKGRLHIYKNIDTNKSRKYLFKILKYLFPKDYDSYNWDCIRYEKYFSGGSENNEWSAYFEYGVKDYILLSDIIDICQNKN